MRCERGVWARFRRREREALLALLPEGGLGEVLELGAGGGYYSRLLAPRGSRLTCLDFSPSMLAALPVGCVKVLADMETFDTAENFDLVFCAGALEFLHAPEALFARLARWLVPGGCAVFLLPLSSLAGRGYRIFHRRNGIGVRLFGLPQVQAWAAAAGLLPGPSRRAPPFSLALRLEKPTHG